MNSYEKSFILAGLIAWGADAGISAATIAANIASNAGSTSPLSKLLSSAAAPGTIAGVCAILDAIRGSVGDYTLTATGTTNTALRVYSVSVAS